MFLSYTRLFTMFTLNHILICTGDQHQPKPLDVTIHQLLLYLVFYFLHEFEPVSQAHVEALRQDVPVLYIHQVSVSLLRHHAVVVTLCLQPVM